LVKKDASFVFGQTFLYVKTTIEIIKTTI